MPETIIHDSISSGSALLAYGESPQLKKNKLFLALGIVIALLITLVTASILVLRTKIPLPRSTVALAFIWPQQKIPDSWPVLWKQAQIKNAPLPFFAGLAKDTPEHYSPFAVGIFGLADAVKIKSGAIKLLSENEFQDYVYQPIGNLPASKRDYAGVWLKIWPEEITAVGLPTDFDLKKGFGGPISGNIWKTNLVISALTDTHSAINGQNYILVSAVPELWPSIQELLAEKSINLNLDILPESITWNTGEQAITSLKLEFNEAINATTAAIIAGSIGISDSKPYTLPDGTVIREMRVPYQTISASTSSQWTTDDENQLIIDVNTAIIGDRTELENEVQLPENCQGGVLALFDPKNLSPVFDKYGFKLTPDGRQLIFLENRGYLNVCW